MKYDITLRTLIGRGAPALIRMVSGAEVTIRLPTEFPATRDQRVDTLVRLDDGRILHVEWQADYDGDMPWRMLGYWLVISRLYPGVPIVQMVIQVGGDSLIVGFLEADTLSYRYQVVDSRAVDPAPLLASAAIEDNVLAILFGKDDLRTKIRAILARVVMLDERPQRDALTQLLILAGLRGATGLVLEVMEEMPLHIDIERDPYLAELVRKGRIEGEARGEAKGEAKALLRLLERRFGPVSADWRERVMAADPEQIEGWLDRVIDAPTPEALFGDSPRN